MFSNLLNRATRPMRFRTTGAVLFSLVLTFCAYLCSFASDGGGIGVTVVNYTLDSTHDVNLGYSITVNADVTNFDTTTFTGALTFGLRNNESIITSEGVFNRPPYSGDVITLQGHSTIPAIFNVYISPAYFTPGPDVVVIWPIFAGNPQDSIVIAINVIDPSAVNNVKAAPFTYIVTDGGIVLKNSGNSFKQVRLYNLLGQQIYELHAANITEVPTANLSKGVYLCELTAADGSRQVIRFIYPPAF